MANATLPFVVERDQLENIVFSLTEADLKTLCGLNKFPVRREDMVFMGFRGCLPANPGNQSFAESHQFVPESVNYANPRCSILQWLPDEGVFAAFPASTVPHEKSIKAALAKNGEGANQLLTGYYADFRKGRHKGFKPTGHEAFLQTGSRLYRRTQDNSTYDNLDRVETGNPGDNLHCGWFAGLDAGYSSAGCQVVMGFPECAQRGSAPNIGPWKTFHENAYAKRSGQDSFGYVLLNGLEVQRLALSGPEGMERVRFGSSGAESEKVQIALKSKGHYEGDADGEFGPRSLRALLAFQDAAFGPGGDDGICGPQTAQALGIPWPS